MDHLATVHSIYTAFGRGDIPAILDCLAGDVVWDEDGASHGIPIYEPGVGKAHVERFFAALQALEFVTFAPTNFLAGGNQVAVPIQVVVRVRATGKLVEALEVHLWTFRDDGKVQRFFHAVDRHAFLVGYQP